ncbi:phosphotransferase [Nocardia uniformis]|uniref:Phosphotransferase n=1 Tax=Nocardia uniformis TaxID=53432 RepID=A0A849C4M6_9NOCA|nr:phosphotransferase [Nocardia uniformis]NNH73654.1 phosphotransferase [Nocardia uniformis]
MIVFEGVAQRDEWRELPESVREAVVDGLGGPVVSAVNQRGGFSHGMAAVLVLADGSRAFAKAIRADDALAGPYHAEAAAAQGLSELVPTPAVLFTVERDSWFVVVFEFVAGRHPQLDRPEDLHAVLGLLDRMAEALTPSPLPETPWVAEVYGPQLRRWSVFAEQGAPQDLDPWAMRNLDRLAALEERWLEWADGETLLHTDLRPDNLMVTADGSAMVVDWAWPCRGAAWIDLAFLAPAIAAAGIDPDPILAEQPVTRDLDPMALDSSLCALAGHWAAQSRLPVPPRSPGLRAYQARAAQTSLAWFKSRIDWS